MLIKSISEQEKWRIKQRIQQENVIKQREMITPKPRKVVKGILAKYNLRLIKGVGIYGA